MQLAGTAAEVIDLTEETDAEEELAPPASKRARGGGGGASTSAAAGSSRQHGSGASGSRQQLAERLCSPGSSRDGRYDDPTLQALLLQTALPAVGSADLREVAWEQLVKAGLLPTTARVQLLQSLSNEQLLQLLERLQLRQTQMELVRQFGREPPRMWDPARPFFSAAQLAAALPPALAVARAPAPALQDPASQHTLSLMCLNVWFSTLLAAERMAGVGLEVERLGYPDLILLQEATPYHRLLLAAQPFWAHYRASPSPSPCAYTLLLCRRDTVRVDAFPPPLWFANSIMSRDVRSAVCSVGGTRLRVATTHLESPCCDPRPPRNGKFSTFWPERRQQHAEMMAHLDASHEPNCIVGGDMNWIGEEEASPMPPQRPGRPSWQDVWLALRDVQADPGNTWDPSVVQQKGKKSGSKSRLDRLFCRLEDWEPLGIELIADQPIPGVTRTVRTAKTHRSDKHGWPVWPSDHLGLHAVFARRHAAADSAGATA